MRVACLTASISRKAGGLQESVQRLCQSLHGLPGTEIHVLAMEDEYSRDDAPGWAPVPIDLFPIRGPRQFGYAPGLKKKLFALDADIVLAQGLWMYPTVAALAWHRRTGRPVVVNPHGMLDPWALRNSAWKKRLMGFFYENPSLRRAACLRALCAAEADSIRAYGLRQPICIIPNGIDLPDERVFPPPSWKGSAESKTVLYLGRLHPKKGLVPLLHAWALLHTAGSLPAETWNLVIAGWNQNGHEEELKTLALQLGITASVRFVGPQFGAAKTAAYQHADAFILPSHSEGLPMTVLEAWAHQLPVIMTPHCHLPEGFEAGAALRAEPEAASLAEGLKALFAMDLPQRQQMGKRGRQLVAERFAWAKIGAQMHDVCQWLLQRGPTPESMAMV